MSPPPQIPADIAHRGGGLQINPAAARHHVRQVLLATGLTPDSASEPFGDALLVASELVTNALVHAGGVTAFAARVRRGALELRVSDPSDIFPTIRDLDHTSPGGFGLPLVTRLCATVDIQLDVPVGKTVTAVIRLPLPSPSES